MPPKRYPMVGLAFLIFLFVGLGSAPLVSAPEDIDIPEAGDTLWFDVMMSFALIAGMTFIGFNMSRGHDPIPGIFMVITGVTLVWSMGWLDTWVFISVLALVSISSAALWSKLFRGKD